MIRSGLFKLSLRKRCERSPHVIYPERFVGQNNEMEPSVKIFSRFLKDEAAATAIAYGLIAAGTPLAVIAAVNGLGSKLSTRFTPINNSLK